MKQWAAIAVLCVFSELATAQKVNEFPKRDDPLHVRVAMFEELMQGNHWNEDVVMPDIIFPPAGEDRPLVGNQEDATGHTGVTLAAYAYKYAVTQDLQDRTLADRLMEAVLTLERVTGVPGVMARTFNRVDEPLWHEQVYFFPSEWHQSTTMPGYRWQGDLSSDKFVDLTYGVSKYWELAADGKHKQVAADFIDRFVGRCVDHNFRLVDFDGKTTLWGNFCPDLPHENLNAMEMLAGLKTAYRLTGKDRYREAYERLIKKYHYDEEAIMARRLWPEMWTVPWDDELASKSFCQLMPYETDPALRNKYTMSLHRYGFAWKSNEYQRSEQLWYPMLYQAFAGVDVLDAKWQEAMRAQWGFDRVKRTFNVPQKDGTVKQMESEEEGNATDLIHNYWFGRYYGFIDPQW